MAISEDMPQTSASSPVSQRSQASPTQGEKPSFFKSVQSLVLALIQSLALALSLTAGILLVLFQDDPTLGFYSVVALGISLSLLFLSNRLSRGLKSDLVRTQIDRKAELQDYLLTDSIDINYLKAVRAKALEYCQDLIDDYKKTRRNSRFIYYSSQLLTITLSGVTPILVLLERGETNIPWLRWLPVIFPAVAAIVTSIATSFPFQENFVGANTTVELLEAEQEKFLLGITPPYRSYDISEERPRRQKAKRAIENFIVQVNSIHLKQVQSTALGDEPGEQGESLRTPTSSITLTEAASSPLSSSTPSTPSEPSVS